MAVDYEYDEQSAVQADANADRIVDGGKYIGSFSKVYRVVSQKGSQGIHFAFDAPGQGNCEFELYTHDKDDKKNAGPGPNFVNALMFFFGLKSLRTEPGLVDIWVEGESGKRVKEEAEVDVYPDMQAKKIGLVLQRETTDNGARMNLYGLFDPVTSLTMSEVKANVTKPVKLERLLKGMKNKDGRSKAPASAEPGQPSPGVDAGD